VDGLKNGMATTLGGSACGRITGEAEEAGALKGVLADCAQRLCVPKLAAINATKQSAGSTEALKLDMDLCC
jgi:hypothetical protein